MSRIIKDYGYIEKFKDTLEVAAEDIEKIDLPLAVIPNHGTFAVQAKAFEKEKGIHFYLYPLKQDKTLGDQLTTIVVDEEQFCDAIFECVMDGIAIEDSQTIREIVRQLVLTVFPDIKKGTDQQILATSYNDEE